MAEKPEDLSLPASVVARIIKDAVPEGVNVSKEARTAIGKAASVFILYATACANNFALKGKRKTLNASDVFAALEDMEFDQMVPELKECLEAYKQEQKGKREAAADRRKLKQAAAAQATTHPPPEPVAGSGMTSLPPSLLPTATVIQAQALSSLAAALSASPHILTTSAPVVTPDVGAPVGASMDEESAVDGESMEVDPVVNNTNQSAPSQLPPPLASADVTASVPSN